MRRSSECRRGCRQLEITNGRGFGHALRGARCYEYKPVANAAIIAVRVDLANTQDDEDSQVNQLKLVQFLMA
jgi:hypothetical protein